ncbi:hypothetical protein GQ600_23658 [Phytophthora cactorum]|nr:hypothetical protein GQ600_23658 [Phytophthora cactorum]
MEMPTVLTPYQRMRELLSVKGLGRAAGPRVDDLQTYLRSDRSARIIIRLNSCGVRIMGTTTGRWCVFISRTQKHQSHWKPCLVYVDWIEFHCFEWERTLTPFWSLSPCGTWKANRTPTDAWCVVDIIEYSHLQLFTWQAVPIDGTTIADALVS